MGARSINSCATARAGRSPGGHRRGLHAARAALAGVEAGSDSGAVGRLRRQDGAGRTTARSAKDATVSSISRYFEELVADLTDKSQRDPKTKLMNFGRFTEQLESFLALEQRGRWCAIGLCRYHQLQVGLTTTLGTSAGDRIIWRVARLLANRS